MGLGVVMCILEEIWGMMFFNKLIWMVVFIRNGYWSVMVFNFYVLYVGIVMYLRNEIIY